MENEYVKPEEYTKDYLEFTVFSFELFYFFGACVQGYFRYLGLLFAVFLRWLIFFSYF